MTRACFALATRPLTLATQQHSRQQATNVIAGSRPWTEYRPTRRTASTRSSQPASPQAQAQAQARPRRIHRRWAGRRAKTLASRARRPRQSRRPRARRTTATQAKVEEEELDSRQRSTMYVSVHLVSFARQLTAPRTCACRLATCVACARYAATGRGLSVHAAKSEARSARSATWCRRTFPPALYATISSVLTTERGSSSAIPDFKEETRIAALEARLGAHLSVGPCERLR